MFPAENPSIDVSVQDSTSTLFQYFLMTEIKKDIVLTAPVALEATVINVDAGHGFIGATAGENLVLWNGNIFTQATVVSVATNAITIRTPVTNEFPIAGTQVWRGNINMNVDGSGTDVDYLFSFGLGAIVPIDISAAIITLTHAGVADDGKFGGIAELTKGVYMRIEGDKGYSPLGNYAKNNSFKNVGGVVDYTDKGPAGVNATDVDFDIRRTFGQVIRLDPRNFDKWKAVVRDKIDAAAGIASFQLSLLGSYTSGE